MTGRVSLDAVIFDWGGTLTPWDSIDPVDPWRAYTSLYCPADPEPLARLIAEVEGERWAAQRRSAGHLGTGPLDDLLAHCGVDTASTAHQEALLAYVQWWEPLTVADSQAAPLLVALRQRGLLIGVLSNTQWPVGFHDDVLVRDGLRHLIDGAVFSSELPVGKPHPDAFHAALSSLGLDDPARAVFVGDRPYDDVHGAQSVGMRAILLQHGNLDATELVDVDGEPDAVVGELADVLDVIDGWL